ncbi:hypothetical protein BN946_scf184523.g2 [Trametes cinnabarina]|uniref:DH domain-containing protein n=1 Tax=Pycnoporus cinnabarinus TaxID=5643 RepID=A0A060STW7_PYCCI|nr:hypothetical protein BN946_scf184523.g2 [Trametes cinnabarina]
MSASLDLFPLRTSSNHYPDLPDHLAVSSFLAHPPSPYARPLARRPSSAYLPFVPLTPIMASPLLTPDLPHAPSPAAVLDSAAAHDPPLPQHQQADYISHHANPTWTTSPPTPPSKQPSPSPPSPLHALGGRTSSSARSSLPGSVTSSTASTNRSGPRPASIASYAPTPLSCSYSPDLSSESRTTSAPTARASALPTRRLSLPSDLSEPLPPRPQLAKELPPLPMHPQSTAVDRAETLLPSLSRRQGHADALAPRPDGASASAGAEQTETGTLRAHARRLFSLADDDDGDADGDLSDSEDRVQKSSAREGTDSGQESAAAQATARDRDQEKERAERVRRYHALMELLTTEVGYLLDLRVLVTVYLDQLLLLSAASPSAIAAVPVGPSALPAPPLPLPSSGRSMSSGLSALFPSSRSSFFHHHSPAPSPSPSIADFLAGSTNVVDADDDRPRDRTRQSSGTSTSTDGTSRERERDNENLARIPPYSGRPGKSTRGRWKTCAGTGRRWCRIWSSMWSRSSRPRL